MPDCTHCTSSFEDELAYLNHLCDEHADDLTRIDKKRIERHPDVEVPGDPAEPTNTELAVQGVIITIGLVLTVGLLYLLATNAASFLF